MQKRAVFFPFLVLLVFLTSACETVPQAPERVGDSPVASAPALPPVAAEPALCPPAPACICKNCPAMPGEPPPPRKLAEYTLSRFEALPGWRDDALADAWPALLKSCRALEGRSAAEHWRAACQAAVSLGAAPDTASVRRFFERQFTPWQISAPEAGAEGLITGYYEPVLKGDRQRGGKAQHPILAVPDDLLSIELADAYPDLKGMRLRGRVDGQRVVPYFPRAGIREREAQYRAIAWVEDPVELFFLHIQGSGRVALPDGSRLRVGYADQNGHPYQSIGRVLIERGALRPEQASMQGIQAWARANPQALDDLLNANPSYVFFRELDLPAHEGPIGALGVPLDAERTLAVDPRAVPLGAPVFLSTTHPNSAHPLRRLMLAQDTGGAIRGAVRADFFWGLGHEAGQKAGKMRQRGYVWLLLPNGVSPAALLPAVAQK